MPLFENSFCPVCNRKFEEGDDVVYCPDCGTPHHRECYKAVGHCVNKGLHASGYSYYAEMKASQSASNNETAQEKEEKPSLFQNSADENGENSNQFNPFIVPSPVQYDAAYEKDEQKIDGESVSDFATTIRSNIPRFIKIFKEFESGSRKTSWNWGAFVFGSLYLFFRKMYKQGIAFFCSFIAVIYASCFAILKLAPNYVEAAKNFANLYAQNKATTDDIVALSKIPDISTANTIVYITFAVIIVIRIIAALYADRFYKKTVTELIKSVNVQLKEGASFIQAPLIPSQNVDMSQEQMRKYYLSRRGGTTAFLPMLTAFSAYLLISMAYSMFY